MISTADKGHCYRTGSTSAGPVPREPLETTLRLEPSAAPWARAYSRGAADRDVRARSSPRGQPLGRLAAGRPLGLGAGRPVRPGDSGLPGVAAPVPGAAAVGGTPGSLSTEQWAQQSCSAVLRWAQPAREGAGREEGADPLQEII